MRSGTTLLSAGINPNLLTLVSSPITIPFPVRRRPAKTLIPRTTSICANSNTNNNSKPCRLIALLLLVLMAATMVTIPTAAVVAAAAGAGQSEGGESR